MEWEAVIRLNSHETCGPLVGGSTAPCLKSACLQVAQDESSATCCAILLSTSACPMHNPSPSTMRTSGQGRLSPWCVGWPPHACNSRIESVTSARCQAMTGVGTEETQNGCQIDNGFSAPVLYRALTNLQGNRDLAVDWSSPSLRHQP